MTTLISPPSWRAIQKKNFTQLKPLCDFLELSLEQRAQLKVPLNFVLNLPYRLAEKIEKSTLNDPILRQFVPHVDELKSTPGFSKDPIDEALFRKEARYLQKYKGRVLLITTSACAMHCRYCFRKAFDYPLEKNFSKEIQLIEEDPSLHEVILSGGDPLSLSNEALKKLLSHLFSIPHVTKIRFHTRFAIGIPERIDEEFLQLLEQSNKQIYFVLHINHPKELDLDHQLAFKKLQKVGVVLLNQAVLLKNINDHFEVQLELCQKLVDMGVLPYYLHQLDRVEGSYHFEVSREKGKQIIHYLRSHLPGYAVPTYVQEIPGEPNKTPL